MGIFDPPETNDPFLLAAWFLFMVFALPVVLIVVLFQYIYKNRKEISERVEEFEDEEVQREIHSGFQWRAILRGLTIFFGGSFSIIGVLLGIVSILYNIRTPEGMTGPPLSMGLSVGIFLISLIVFALLIKRMQIISFGERFPLNRM